MSRAKSKRREPRPWGRMLGFAMAAFVTLACAIQNVDPQEILFRAIVAAVVVGIVAGLTAKSINLFGYEKVVFESSVAALLVDGKSGSREAVRPGVYINNFDVAIGNNNFFKKHLHFVFFYIQFPSFLKKNPSNIYV